MNYQPTTATPINDALNAFNGASHIVAIRDLVLHILSPKGNSYRAYKALNQAVKESYDACEFNVATLKDLYLILSLLHELALNAKYENPMAYTWVEQCIRWGVGGLLEYVRQYGVWCKLSHEQVREFNEFVDSFLVDDETMVYYLTSK